MSVNTAVAIAPDKVDARAIRFTASVTAAVTQMPTGDSAPRM